MHHMETITAALILVAVPLMMVALILLFK
jgi:hypothetical protein